MKELHGKVAAVTGAASGIGRMLALVLAEEGCAVAIADVDATGLQQTATMVGERGGTVSEHLLDVGRKEQVYAYAEDVVARYGQVDLVVNNAGVGLATTLEEVEYEDFEWIVGVNFWGVVYGSKAFLPHLKARPQAHICNISSVHGLFTNPGVGPYCSTKFAVRGFSLTLAQELKDTSVGVSCVHPGGIKTNVVRNTRYPPGVSQEERERKLQTFEQYIAHTSAERAARSIVRGIKKGRTRILVGFDAYIFDAAVRLFPGLWQRLMGTVARGPTDRS
jgi:NAD(P)-dependent dehydrogenase (short-subunit alcohol dehydrogenase family)